MCADTEPSYSTNGTRVKNLIFLCKQNNIIQVQANGISDTFVCFNTKARELKNLT